MSLDDMIESNKSKSKGHVRTTNANELRDKIEKYKERAERFLNDEEEAERRLEKIQRMEKKLAWTEHKAPPLPI